MSTPNTLAAYQLAYKRHGAKKQKRKGTGEPYIVHPAQVASILTAVDADENMVTAGLLHDVVEDTFHNRDFGLAVINQRFGDDVASLVEMVTKISMHHPGKRAVRKEMDKLHLDTAKPRGKTLKLSDCVSNMSTVHLLRHDSFLKIYLPEMRALVEILGQGDQALMDVFVRQLKQAMPLVGLRY